MTPKQQTLHKSLIKALHLSKTYQEYYKEDKEDYVKLLKFHFGVDSSKKLDIDNLIILVDFMNRKNTMLPVYRPEEKSDGLCSEAQLKMMLSLWKSFASNPTEETLLSFANRQTSKQYLHLHMISKSEAQKIIPVLKTMQKNIVIIK